ncbi:LCP family protein, partial [Turicibacter bilis]
MFNNKGLKWIYRIIMILPIIPIIWNIIYINQYSGFDSLLRLNLSLIFIFLYLAILMFGLYVVKEENKVGTIILTIVALIGLFTGTYFGYVNTRVYHSLNNMTMQDSIISYSLVTMADSPFTEVKDLEGYTIGTLNLTKQEVIDNIDQFLEENELTDEAEVEKYDSPISMIHDLYDGKVDAIIVGDNYGSLFSEQLGFEDIKNETKILANIETVIQQEELKPGMANTSLIDDPFSILLIGVDSTEQGLEAASLADSLIIATVNPQNLSVTMTSIPRDSYVEIPCFNNTKDKITHSNNGGTTCVIESVEKMFDLNIPYYVKINFKGVVELVDTIGGIYVDVPVTIEEQDSNRQFGEHLITVEEGYQHLNGEQALALSRHRKTLAKGDLGRAEHQQLVIEGIVNQMLTEMNTVGEFLDLLDVLGNNIETNISLNQMTSSLQYLLGLVSTFNGQNPLDYIHIKSMVVSAQYGYMDNPYYSFKLSYAFPYKGAIADAREQMLINLEKESPQFNYSFTFNGFEEYEGTQWVQTYYNEPLPGGATENNVTTDDEEEVKITVTDKNTSLTNDKTINNPSSSSNGSNGITNDGSNSESSNGSNGITNDGSNSESSNGSNGITNDGSNSESSNGSNGITNDGSNSESSNGSNGITNDGSNSESNNESNG